MEARKQKRIEEKQQGAPQESMQMRSKELWINVCE